MPKTVQDQAASSTRTTVCSIHKMMFMLMMRKSRTRRRQARRSSKLDFEHDPATPTLTLGCLNQALTKPLAACLRLLHFCRYVSQTHTTHGYLHGSYAHLTGLRGAHNFECFLKPSHNATSAASNTTFHSTANPQAMFGYQCRKRYGHLCCCYRKFPPRQDRKSVV